MSGILASIAGLNRWQAALLAAFVSLLGVWFFWWLASRRSKKSTSTQDTPAGPITISGPTGVGNVGSKNVGAAATGAGAQAAVTTGSASPNIINSPNAVGRAIINVTALTIPAPKPVLNLRKEKDALYLDVRNDGEAADFAAEIRFLKIEAPTSYGTKPSDTKPYKPSWSSGFAKSRILREGTDSIVLAVIGPPSLFYGWRYIKFPYTDKNFWDWDVFTVGGVGATRQGSHASVRLKIIVTSDPSPNGPVPKRIFTTDENFSITSEEQPTL